MLTVTDVPRDNVRTATICGEEMEFEASLGAALTYANEFRGKLERPYRGQLYDDILTIWGKAQETVTDPETGEDVPNPDYEGVDLEAVLRVAWAMAWAAGSTKKHYKAWLDDIAHRSGGIFDQSQLWLTVIVELGGGVIFRTPGGQEGADAPDEKEGA